MGWPGQAASPARHWALALVGLLALGPVASGQLNLAKTLTARSYSGQFVVRGYPQPARLPELFANSPATNWARLEPRLLAMSCERIKQAMLGALGASDHWRSKVYLNIHPLRSLNEPVQIVSTRFADGWTYQVDVPDAVDPTVFVEAFTRILLTEWANRGATDRLAEAPEWLNQGLAAELLATSPVELLVRPANMEVGGILVRRGGHQGRLANPLAPAHQFLDTHPPLTLEELSWPKPEATQGDAALAYRYSAQLFVHELLRLKGGQAAMVALLETLPRHLNWQTAFLESFPTQFPRMLDLEKWWELRSVHFTTHELTQHWNREESLRKLDELLRASVQVSAGTNAPGQRMELPLPAFILRVDYERQREVWPFKVDQLQRLAPWLEPEVNALAGAYLKVIETYLQRMDRGRNSTANRPNRFEQAHIAQDAARQLDALDRQRAVLLRAGPASSPSVAKPPPANRGVPARR